MISVSDATAIGKVIKQRIEEASAAIVANLMAQISTLAERVEAIPQPLKGEKGDKGDQGPQGPAGADAVVDIPAIVAQVVSQIPVPENGKDGKDGESITGPVGPQGPQGEAGKDAIVDIPSIVSTVLASVPTPKDGIDGRDGKDGLPGKDGIDGAQGIQGERGENGRDGRDALQLDILPSVDLSRSYPRNTYARYDGGLIRSYRDTVPGESLEKSGWEVVVAGLSSIAIAQSDDKREFTVSCKVTGGEPVSNSFSMPAMIYREIFKDGTDYKRGDVVTWGGSAWHCQNDTKATPGKSTDWKLMVKEGRAGKDGKDGERGPQGLKGEAGRDLTQMGYDGKKW